MSDPDRGQLASPPPTAAAVPELAQEPAPEPAPEPAAEAGNDDDADSDILSDLDEKTFADFNEKQYIKMRDPIPIDDDTVHALGVHKKKRTSSPAPKKRPEKRRRDLRRRGDGLDDEEEDRVRITPEVELTAEERRRRELDRKMDEALKKRSSRKKKRTNDHDLEMMDDKTVEDLVRRMINAAELDAEAVDNGKAAILKLNMVTEVAATMSRPHLLNIALDCQMLTAIRHWLEPLPNRALPAYNVQKLMFDLLGKLKPESGLLRESGIGKIVMFYTKDIRPQPQIKRQAEILVRDWSRPVLGRPDDYRTREVPTAGYDGPVRRPARSAYRDDDEERTNPLALPRKESNRARPVLEGPRNYEIAPQSRLVNGYNAFAKPIGSQGDDLVRRLKAKKSKAKGPKSGMIIG